MVNNLTSVSSTWHGLSVTQLNKKHPITKFSVYKSEGTKRIVIKFNSLIELLQTMSKKKILETKIFLQV